MAFKGSVVVTGVSTGIGRATAEGLITQGYRVFGSVRKKAQGEELAKGWGEAFEPLEFDVTDAPAIGRAKDRVAKLLGDEPLFGLVNNAGIAVSGPLQHLPPDELRHQLDVNVMGPLLVTQAFLPLLGARPEFAGRPGRIVNISSVAGRLVFPFLGPYAMSKHALEAQSDALRRELQIFGVDVVVIGPGAVATPIWDKADAMDLEPYRGTAYLPAMTKALEQLIPNGRQGFDPAVIGQFVLKALTTRRPKARYAVVPNRLARWTIPTLLPKRRLDAVLRKVLGLVREG